MTKLPINPLLYLASIGLAGGSGLLFYHTMTAPEPKRLQQITAESETLRQKGRERTPDDRRDDYTEAAKAWWLQLQEANFVGKLPPEPEEAKPSGPEPPKAATVTPVAELLDVVCILADAAGGGLCVVKYKETANVQPPVKVARSAAAPYAGPSDTGARPEPIPAGQPAVAPKPGRPQAARPALAVPGATAGLGVALLHHLRIGDVLWPPYDDTALVRVEQDASAAYFARKGEAPEGTTGEEKVFRNELQLRQDVLEELAQHPIVVPGAGRPARPEPSASAAPAAAPAGQWVDVGEHTRTVRPGHWHISRSDDRYLEENAQRIFNEDVTLQSYSSQSGNVHGVRVAKISAQLERFGVQAGDVLLELNGVPVRSKAEALSIGKKQYQQGQRVFRARILNRYGRVEERTYYAPEK